MVLKRFVTYLEREGRAPYSEHKATHRRILRVAFLVAVPPARLVHIKPITAAITVFHMTGGGCRKVRADDQNIAIDIAFQ